MAQVNLSDITVYRGCAESTESIARNCLPSPDTTAIFVDANDSYHFFNSENKEFTCVDNKCSLTGKKLEDYLKALGCDKQAKMALSPTSATDDTSAKKQKISDLLTKLKEIEGQKTRAQKLRESVEAGHLPSAKFDDFIKAFEGDIKNLERISALLTELERIPGQGKRAQGLRKSVEGGLLPSAKFDDFIKALEGDIIKLERIKTLLTELERISGQEKRAQGLRKSVEGGLLPSAKFDDFIKALEGDIAKAKETPPPPPPAAQPQIALAPPAQPQPPSPAPPAPPAKPEQVAAAVEPAKPAASVPKVEAKPAQKAPPVPPAPAEEPAAEVKLAEQAPLQPQIAPAPPAQPQPLPAPAKPAEPEEAPPPPPAAKAKPVEQIQPAQTPVAPPLPPPSPQLPEAVPTVTTLPPSPAPEKPAGQASTAPVSFEPTVPTPSQPAPQEKEVATATETVPPSALPPYSFPIDKNVSDIFSAKIKARKELTNFQQTLSNPLDVIKKNGQIFSTYFQNQDGTIEVLAYIVSDKQKRNELVLKKEPAQLDAFIKGQIVGAYQALEKKITGELPKILSNEKTSHKDLVAYNKNVFLPTKATFESMLNLMKTLEISIPASETEQMLKEAKEQIDQLIPYKRASEVTTAFLKDVKKANQDKRLQAIKDGLKKQVLPAFYELKTAEHKNIIAANVNTGISNLIDEITPNTFAKPEEAEGIIRLLENENEFSAIRDLLMFRSRLEEVKKEPSTPQPATSAEPEKAAEQAQPLLEPIVPTLKPQAQPPEAEQPAFALPVQPPPPAAEAAKPLPPAPAKEPAAEAKPAAPAQPIEVAMARPSVPAEPAKGTFWPKGHERMEGVDVAALTIDMDSLVKNLSWHRNPPPNVVLETSAPIFETTTAEEGGTSEQPPKNVVAFRMATVKKFVTEVVNWQLAEIGKETKVEKGKTFLHLKVTVERKDVIQFGGEVDAKIAFRKSGTREPGNGDYEGMSADVAKAMMTVFPGDIKMSITPETARMVFEVVGSDLQVHLTKYVILIKLPVPTVTFSKTTEGNGKSRGVEPPKPQPSPEKLPESPKSGTDGGASNGDINKFNTLCASAIQYAEVLDDKNFQSTFSKIKTLYGTFWPSIQNTKDAGIVEQKHNEIKGISSQFNGQ